jgi:hypothetical protein
LTVILEGEVGTIGITDETIPDPARELPALTEPASQSD